MNDQSGPVIFASIYTAGVLLTILLAMAYANWGEPVAKTGLAVLQIAATIGAIFSAWALQQHKRFTDQADLATSTADAVLAVALSIDKTYAFVAEKASTGQTTKKLFEGNAATLRDEVTALASVPLAALKPAQAAVALVEYRRKVRQGAIILDRCAEDIAPGSQTKRVAARLVIIRTMERELYEALGRNLPKRLDSDEYVSDPEDH